LLAAETKDVETSSSALSHRTRPTGRASIPHPAFPFRAARDPLRAAVPDDFPFQHELQMFAIKFAAMHGDRIAGND